MGTPQSAVKFFAVMIGTIDQCNEIHENGKQCGADRFAFVSAVTEHEPGCCEQSTTRAVNDLADIVEDVITAVQPVCDSIWDQLDDNHIHRGDYFTLPVELEINESEQNLVVEAKGLIAKVERAPILCDRCGRLNNDEQREAFTTLIANLRRDTYS